MKKHLTLFLCLLFLTSFATPKKANATDPLTITAAVLVGITSGAAISYTIIGYVLDATLDASSDSMSVAFKMQYVNNVQNDAMEFLATDGEQVSALLSAIIERTSEELDASGQDISMISREMLVREVLKNARVELL
jgi:hypothetical protein